MRAFLLTGLCMIFTFMTTPAKSEMPRRDFLGALCSLSFQPDLQSNPALGLENFAQETAQNLVDGGRLHPSHLVRVYEDIRWQAWHAIQEHARAHRNQKTFTLELALKVELAAGSPVALAPSFAVETTGKWFDSGRGQEAEVTSLRLL